jgi:hypothetical protein
VEHHRGRVLYNYKSVLDGSRRAHSRFTFRLSITVRARKRRAKRDLAAEPAVSRARARLAHSYARRRAIRGAGATISGTARTVQLRFGSVQLERRITSARERTYERGGLSSATTKLHGRSTLLVIGRHLAGSSQPLTSIRSPSPP